MTAQDIAGLLPLVLIVAVFYLLLLRPARNRQREMSRLQSRIAPGQQVMTGSGLYATVTAVDEDSVTLETSPGVRSRWSRAAIARVLDDPGSGGAGSGGAGSDDAESPGGATAAPREGAPGHGARDIGPDDDGPDDGARGGRPAG